MFDPNVNGFAPGFAFAIAGLTVLFSNIPPLRDFTILDAVRTTVAAICFAGIIFLYNKVVRAWMYGVFLLLLLLLFVPWRPKSRRRKAVDRAIDALDMLSEVDVISSSEHIEAARELERRAQGK